MQVKTPHIEPGEIRTDQEEILRLLSAQPGGEDAHTRSLVDQYITECREIMRPSAAYVLVDAEPDGEAESIAAGGQVFQTGKIVQRMLRQAEHYGIFVVTIGPGPETMARELLEKGEYLEGYIADLIASALVDSAADVVHEDIRRYAAQSGMKVSNRYSPGYCSWDVSEQQKLFSFFSGQSCGITLSESSLMDPVKSISGIIALGSGVKFNDYTCEICPMKECSFRKPRGL